MMCKNIKFSFRFYYIVLLGLALLFTSDYTYYIILHYIIVWVKTYYF